MTDRARAIFDAVLPARLPEPVPFSADAPSNIALSKYWGKRDAGLNLPLNSSLSISLAEWGTTTRVGPAEDGTDAVWLNGERLAPETGFARKVVAFADRFRRAQTLPLHVRTENTIPTAAGLASSASGFAALTRALAGSFGLDLAEDRLSMLARFGSGSATRSLWHGFVRWDRGAREDGTDSFARPLPETWSDFRIAIIRVDTGPKSQSSRDGMGHTVATSPLFGQWPEQAEADCAAIEAAIEARDFLRLGALTEANALAMHATMIAARPALCYLKPESWQVLDRLWAARRDGLEAYATMDAGANVKLIFLEDSAPAIAELFPDAAIVEPFGPAAQR
ncbi:diphosphomevalonate decarboxylase [Rhodovulum sulfidophilum]|uniref:diphosphomevalonate decarboxylase n=1 Tax=Rhodovulum sulfidophilum TaxID=35806 RepID=UPI000951FA3A|nr:diphosphomevalonate decarboxylase [Rhodovulum sulfidophilum]MBL3550904.1 diphosphomevalonate decarboxylase [Rhodovulum sulfidophilum]OLS49444.1 diphosphomevalonate decarboxylase [Rhodovulum sulfidophilum]